jgi:hypothetical protein
MTKLTGNAFNLVRVEDPDQPDIISEALNLFRANALFRNFEIQGPADRVLIYLILFIGDCLTKIGSCTFFPPRCSRYTFLLSLRPCRGIPRGIQIDEKDATVNRALITPQMSQPKRPDGLMPRQ